MRCNVSDITGSNQFSDVLFYIRFNTFAFFLNVQGGCQRLYCGTRLVNISFHCLRQVVELSERHLFFFHNIFQDKTFIFASVVIFMYMYLFEFSCITNKNKWAAGEGGDENFFFGKTTLIFCSFK